MPFVRCSVFLGRCARSCDVCRVAFPLVMLSRLKFSLVLAFRAFVRVFIVVKSLIAIIDGFEGVSRLAFAPLVRDAVR